MLFGNYMYKDEENNLSMKDSTRTDVHVDTNQSCSRWQHCHRVRLNHVLSLGGGQYPQMTVCRSNQLSCSGHHL